jgi:RNA polymerase subunit RPABC4/transcription elongation factor Spt4
VLDENLLLGLTVYGGVVLATFWLALIIWAYRDMRARSRDSLAQLLVTFVVAILNIPGVFIYIMLRPRETLTEAYERSLEEEALLQEIEEKPACPGCGQRVQVEWQACPYCHTRLKKACHVCHNLLELSWNLCPHCASPQNQYQPDDEIINVSRHVQRTAPAAPNIPDKWPNTPSSTPSNTLDYNVDTDANTNAGSVEFIDDEY